MLKIPLEKHDHTDIERRKTRQEKHKKLKKKERNLHISENGIKFATKIEKWRNLSSKETQQRKSRKS